MAASPKIFKLRFCSVKFTPVSLVVIAGSKVLLAKARKQSHHRQVTPNTHR